jgi:hypothetical protein
VHAVDDRPLQERVVVRDERIELIVRDEVVVHAVDFTRTWRPSCDRNRDEDLWMLPTQASDDGSLARCGRSGKYGEAGLRHDR